MHLTGNFKDAGEYYLKAVTYKEDYFQAYRALGWLARETLQYDEALQWVRKALSINSADLETIFLKGVIHFERKESKLAVNDFTRCMELRPDYGRAGCFLGMTFFQLGNVTKAIDHLRQSIELGGDINAPYLIGYYQFINGDYDGAVKSLQNAVENTEIAFIAHFYLGLIHMLTDRKDTGLKSIEKSADLCRELIANQPEFYIVKAVQAINLAYLGRHDEAEELIQEIEVPAAADGSLAHEIARAYAVMNRPDKAAEYSLNAVATLQGPTSVEIALDPLLKEIVID
jgi:superkiller protein 3